MLPGMGHYDDEIREQPRALQRLLDDGRDEAAALGDAIRRRAPSFVVVAARGSSDNAARYAQYLFGARNDATVALAAPSLFTLYGARPSMKDALVVGISQSGRSPDVVAVLAEARSQGALTVAVTNAQGSPLQGAAEHHLALRAGLERAVPASKTYTTQLLAVAMLSAAWAGDDEALHALDAVPSLVDEAIASASPGAARAAEWSDAERLVVLGRGFLFGTAYEVALKVKETCRVVAEPHSIADFLHGPVAVVDAALRAILVAPSSRADADLDAVELRLVGGGASVAAISDRDEVLARAAIPLRVPRAPEHLAPLPCAVAGQLFSQALARARGFDPDAPQGLAKVTETR